MQFEELLEQSEKDIYYISHRYYVSGMDADDIAQELRIALWKAYKNFNEDVSSWKTYSNMVMYYRIVRLLQQQDDTIYFSDIPESLHPYMSDNGKWVELELERLDPKRREMLIDYFVKELTLMEIANKNGVSHATVYRKIYGKKK